jgi:hypothetical protein
METKEIFPTTEKESYILTDTDYLLIHSIRELTKEIKQLGNFLAGLKN